MSDRDEIGEIIGQTYYSSHFEPAHNAADAILASPWLARRDAEVAAKALEDARQQGVRHNVAINDRFHDAGEHGPEYWEGFAGGSRNWDDLLSVRARSLRASSLGAENPETSDES